MEIKQRAFLLHLLVCCFILSYDGVKSSTVKLSREENIEVELQLKRINKPAVKILKTILGDSYGCVDFHKQPAFDHPAIRNHALQHNLNTFFGSRKNDKSDDKIWLNGEGCPNGTVPIRRYTKDELINSKTVAKALALHQRLNVTNENQAHHHFANVRTKRDPLMLFTGAGTTISVYNPFPVEAPQLTMSYMSVSRDNDYLQIGWVVHPGVYHDSGTRLFAYTNSGDSHCFNTVCPGFVAVNPSIPVDMPIWPVSMRGGNIFSLPFLLKRDDEFKAWMMLIKKEETPIGYWPFESLGGLKGKADYVEWGGTSFNPDGVVSPPMGSGRMLVKGQANAGEDGFCAHLHTFDENKVKDDKVDYIETYVSDDAGYNALEGGVDANFGHYIYFGGAGGK